ncbi:MAG: hypothetical protein JXR64_01165 [Spirochaetales bacterium]|nr:hypothetical protein [Spirochaetales bacterium]
MSILDAWYKLDNVAKLFPAVTTSKNSSTFRVSVILNTTINKDKLQIAVSSVIKRFPMFAVRIRRGLFWYFLEANDLELLVKEEKDAPCTKIDRYENNDYLLRVLYFNNKISVEFFHSITDGKGAAEFIKLITIEYVKLLTNDNNKTYSLINVDDIPLIEEFEDSFQKYSCSVKTKKIKEIPAKKISGTRFNNFGNNALKIIVDSSSYKYISKKYGCTITEYTVALFAYSIYLDQCNNRNNSDPIVIVVPVNLRSIFPSSTLRNFFSTISIKIIPQDNLSLSNFIPLVSAQFKEKLVKDKLHSEISKNYRSERLIYIRLAPLILKNLILRIAFSSGTKYQTAALSNIGEIVFPENVNKFIDHTEVLLYSSRKNPVNCGVCSSNNKLAITFTRTIVEPNIIKKFINHLVENEGLELKVFTNNWGDV